MNKIHKKIKRELKKKNNRDIPSNPIQKFKFKIKDPKENKDIFWKKGTLLSKLTRISVEMNKMKPVTYKLIFFIQTRLLSEIKEIESKPETRAKKIKFKYIKVLL